MKKHIFNQVGLSLLISAGAMLSSCSNEEATAESAATELQVEVNVANTRSAIDGTSLPAGSTYSLIVRDNAGGKVIKSMKVGEYNTGIKLYPNLTYQVAACYPEVKEVGEKYYVDITPGDVDWLFSGSTGASCSTSKPSAYLTLHHALARVRFHFRADEGVEKSVSMNGLGNVSTRGYMDLYSMMVDYYTPGTLSSHPSIKATLSSTSPIDAEVLLLPQDLITASPVVKVEIDGTTFDISKDVINVTKGSAWSSGLVYDYTIRVHDGVNMDVTGSVISAWGKEQPQGDLSAGDK